MPRREKCPDCKRVKCKCEECSDEEDYEGGFIGSLFRGVTSGVTRGIGTATRGIGTATRGIGTATRGIGSATRGVGASARTGFDDIVEAIAQGTARSAKETAEATAQALARAVAPSIGSRIAQGALIASTIAPSVYGIVSERMQLEEARRNRAADLAQADRDRAEAKRINDLMLAQQGLNPDGTPMKPTAPPSMPPVTEPAVGQPAQPPAGDPDAELLALLASLGLLPGQQPAPQQPAPQQPAPQQPPAQQPSQPPATQPSRPGRPRFGAGKKGGFAQRPVRPFRYLSDSDMGMRFLPRLVDARGNYFDDIYGRFVPVAQNAPRARKSDHPRPEGPRMPSVRPPPGRVPGGFGDISRPRPEPRPIVERPVRGPPPSRRPERPSIHDGVDVASLPMNSLLRSLLSGRFG